MHVPWTIPAKARPQPESVFSANSIVVSGTYSIRDYHALSMLINPMQRRWLTWGRMARIAVTSVLAMAVISHKAAGRIQIDPVLTSILGLMFMLISWAFFWTLRRLAHQAPRARAGIAAVDSTLTMQFDPVGIECTGPEKVFRQRWSDMECYEQSASCLLFRGQSKPLIFVPQRWFNADQWHQIQELVSEKLPLRSRHDD